MWPPLRLFPTWDLPRRYVVPVIFRTRPYNVPNPKPVIAEFTGSSNSTGRVLTLLVDVALCAQRHFGTMHGRGGGNESWDAVAAQRL